jgi:hypothetical protein
MLTNDMTRLCGEIVTLRARRGEMLDTMARTCKDRRESMAELRGQFANTRKAMARKTKADRLAFLHNLRHAVNAQRREMCSDLAGVRKAWTGRAA